MSVDWELLCPVSLREIEDLLRRARLLCSSRWNGQASGLKQKRAPCHDSRQLQAHHIFVALSGQTFDGHQFIAGALESGIRAVVYQSPLQAELARRLERQGIAAFRVKSSRQALSLLSARCFGYPSQKIQVLGITGTDGKTSIAYLCYQILWHCTQEPVGLLSTFGLDFGTGLELNRLHQTTPESLAVQRALARMLANGCRFAVLECSSHGLSQRTARLMHVEFGAGLFSNLSPEHLEFHGSMEHYARDKSNLFAQVKSGGLAVWNAGEPAAEILYGASGARRDIRHWGYAAGALKTAGIPLAQILRAENLKPGLATSQFDLAFAGQVYPCEIAIAGTVYIANVAAALSLCLGVLGENGANKNRNHRENPNENFLERILRSYPVSHTGHYRLDLRAPKGRMERLPASVPFTVVVDYAHSPGAFSRLLPELRNLLEPAARLLLLFGSGGQRDRQKRCLQGELAARYGNIIVLCNEDPRGENEMEILEDIRSGMGSGFLLKQNLFLIPDRRQAMAQIFALARPGDLVLLLGKGHETSIILAGQREIPWDERKVALSLLNELPQT